MPHVGRKLCLLLVCAPYAAAVQDDEWTEVYRAPDRAPATDELVAAYVRGDRLQLISRAGPLEAFQHSDEQDGWVSIPPLLETLDADQRYALSASGRHIALVSYTRENGAATTHAQEIGGDPRSVSVPGIHAVELASDGEHMVWIQQGHALTGGMQVRVVDWEGAHDADIELPRAGLVRYSEDASWLAIQQGGDVHLFSHGRFIFPWSHCGWFALRVRVDSTVLVSEALEDLMIFELRDPEDDEFGGPAAPPTRLPLDARPVDVRFAQDGRALVVTQRSARLWDLSTQPPTYTTLHELREPRRFVSATILADRPGSRLVSALGVRRVLQPRADLRGSPAEPFLPPPLTRVQVRLVDELGESVAARSEELRQWTLGEPQLRALPGAGLMARFSDRLIVWTPGGPR